VKVLRRLCASLHVLVCLVACHAVAEPVQAGPASPAPARPLQVVASFSILADITREVAGPVAVVTSLVGANADAHVYEPSPADVMRVARADLVIVNGLRFEGWIERLIRASGQRRSPLVATRGIVPRRAGGSEDPHAWQDLALAERYVENIRQGLVAAAPAHAPALNRRAGAYRQRLRDLDRRIRADLARVPAAQRVVITSHDAFGYFGAAYGVRFLAPQGWSTDQAPSAAAVAGMIRQVRDHGVRALFVENISDRRLLARIAEDSGARIGGRLYSDALSATDGPAPSYLALMAHNAGTLLQGLEGAAR
jgi:zinc/manganese transport system substrate-binding protein